MISETALILFGIQDGQSTEPNNPLELIYWGNWRERDHLGDSGVDGSIMLNGSSGSGMWGCGLD